MSHSPSTETEKEKAINSNQNNIAKLHPPALEVQGLSPGAGGAKAAEKEITTKQEREAQGLSPGVAKDNEKEQNAEARENRNS